MCFTFPLGQLYDRSEKRDKAGIGTLDIVSIEFEVRDAFLHAGLNLDPVLR